MYHLELRQSFHNFNHFNLDGEDLRALVEPWMREQVIEVGEQKWSPHLAKMRILEGPHLPVEELSMGRGWRTAERESTDVTERIIAEAREAMAAVRPAAVPPAVVLGSASFAPGSAAPAAGLGVAAPTPTPSSSSEPAALGDPLALGVQLASLLGGNPGALLVAWRDVAARSTGLSPSESLALAEREVGGSGGGPGGGR